MELVLECDKCERLAHDPKFDGRICGIRLFDGKYCDGILKPKAEEPELPDPHLECDTCGRRADNMAFVGKVCDWAFADRRHCSGILREAE